MTTTPHPTGRRPSYGIDAPGLVRFMFTAGAVAAVVGVAFALSPWPGGVWAAVGGTLAGLAATYFLGMGCYMLYGSLIGKVRERHRLLDLVPWVGDEAVLDVGCGRGLLLVAAAKRVPTGRAVGIDLWKAEDQADNRPELTLANARLEGVEGRVEVQTADMRELPFADGSFDVVVSHWAVHNLYAQADRARTLAEIGRVLKPGGYLMLADIEHRTEYATRLREHGFADVRVVTSRWRDMVLGALTFGSFRPAAVVARKGG